MILPAEIVSLHGMAVGKDREGGVLVITASAWRPAGAGEKINKYAVGKFSADGVADELFGEGGFAVGSFIPNSGAVESVMAFTLNDRLWVAGGDRFGGQELGFGVSRLTLAGAPDHSFGVGGSVFLRLQDIVGPTSSWLANNVMAALDNRGRMYLALDVYYVNGDSLPIVVRLLDDGVLDKSWGGEGFKVVALELGAGSYATRLQGIHADGDQVIVSANFNRIEGNTGNKNYIARFTGSGELDTSFGTNGVYQYPGASGGVTGWPLLRLVSSSQVEDAPHYLATGARYQVEPVKWLGIVIGLDSNGHPDERFNNGLPVHVEPDPTAAYVDQCMTLPNGRIIATGSRVHGTLICRFESDGRLDRDFGNDGYIIKTEDDATVHDGIFHTHPVVVSNNRMLINFRDKQNRAVVDAYT
ncbi:hypothetical protein, partial [Pseudomonas sp.]|uniref:hypothetical protein n=1 Tax=Pseudomonas sp. TaxID=306 RepID=UPI003CC6D5C2